MTRTLCLLAFALLTGLATAAVGARAQVTGVELMDRGRPVPVDLTPDLTALGRTLTMGLLANAHQDVTRPVSDAEILSLARRGTLLRVDLARPEDVILLRLRSRARASRLAAYVPPDRDDRAFVFLGEADWDRIIVVTLPDPVRDELRRLRSATAAAD